MKDALFVIGVVVSALVGLFFALLITAPVWLLLLAIFLGITQTK